MSKRINRRDFIKTTALAGAAISTMPKILFSASTSKRVKMGFIGTGMRGQWVLWLAAKYPEVDIPAICDIDDGMIESALKILKDAGKPEPRVYKNGDEDFLNMVKNEDLDHALIIVQNKSIKNINYENITSGSNYAKISIIGSGIQNTPGYAAKFFETLFKSKVNIEMITTSDIRITCLINDTDLDKAVNKVHNVFDLFK